MAGARQEGPAPINLDAFVAEALGEPRPVELHGNRYELPPEFPVVAIILFQQTKVYEALKCLFGEDVDALLVAEAGLSINGLGELLVAIASEVYDLDLGESPASGSSSPKSGKPLRPTSKRATS